MRISEICSTGAINWPISRSAAMAAAAAPRGRKNSNCSSAPAPGGCSGRKCGRRSCHGRARRAAGAVLRGCRAPGGQGAARVAAAPAGAGAAGAQLDPHRGHTGAPVGERADTVGRGEGPVRRWPPSSGTSRWTYCAQVESRLDVQGQPGHHPERAQVDDRAGESVPGEARSGCRPAPTSAAGRLGGSSHCGHRNRACRWRPNRRPRCAAARPGWPARSRPVAARGPLRRSGGRPAATRARSRTPGRSRRCRAGRRRGPGRRCCRRSG